MSGVRRMETPQLSHHARMRCLQMGISTKRAKRVVQRRTVTYGGQPGDPARVCMSDDPDVSVVWNPLTNIIVTVLPRTMQQYIRTTTGHELLPDTA